jgi:uncharacterized protein YbaR (Trm112 family)
MTAELIDVLACPRCDKPLDADDSTLRCTGCEIDYPRVGNVPWLFSEPGFSIAEWRQRLDFLLRRLEDDAARIDKTLAEREDLLALTRERLERLKEAVTDHGRRLSELLVPLKAEEPRASFATYLALRTRLPPDQGLATYYPNLHRDWCWGEAENDAALALLAPNLDELAPDANVLVLGSGAGRLAYDLHLSRATGLTVALDFNPLFQLAVTHIVAGETLELYEFPLAPRTLADQALLRELKAPAPTRPGFHAVLGDALRAPFREASFDVVVTPWLIDILPEDFATLCPRINHLLVKGGRWLNLGSLMFSQAGPDKQYSREECSALIEIAGFATPSFEEATIPYMSSPASRHGRRETVLAWRADKTGKAKRPGRHEALPDWLVKGTDPVPVLDAFRVQLTTTRIYAALMSLIDGRRSVKDMAKVLVEQRLMAPPDAEPAIREFLMKMYHDSQRAQRL